MRLWRFLAYVTTGSRLFGLPATIRLLLYDKWRPSTDLRSIPIAIGGRTAFFYRPAYDRDTVLGHLCRPLYRIRDDARPITTIVDAGAHIGDETIRLRAFHPTARILAIEADPENVATLRANCAGDTGITVLHRALWPTHATVRIARGPCAQASHVGDEGTPVETVTPADLLDVCSGAIDVLKIDIEGAERALFCDRAAADWLRHVSMLIVECPDADAPGTTLVLADRLRATGVEWRCAVVDENLVWTQSDVPWTIDREASLAHEARS